MFKKQFTLLIIILSLFCFFISESKADTKRDIFTPRGTLVGDSYTTDELHWTTRRDLDDEYAENYPDATQLTLWGEQYSSSRRYNCHGYAWHMIGDDAINDPVCIGCSSAGQTYKYWMDESYSEVAVQYATMVDYSGDHSATTTAQTDIYISKWNMFPLMRHHKDLHPGYGNPVKFLRKNPATPSDFATIQAAINDAVSGQIVHVDAGVPALSANITVPSGITLKIHSGATVNLNSYYIKCSGSGKIVKQGTVTGYTHYAQSGSDYKGYFPSSVSIQQIIDWATSGWDVHVGSGTFAGTINMKSGVDVIGAGATSTYVGQANFSSDTNCEFKNLNSSDLNISGGNYTTKVTNFRTNNKIEITGGNAWLENVEFLQGDYNCGIDVNGGYPSLVDITSTTSRSDPGDPAVYIHNSGSPAIDVGSIQYKNRGIQLGDYCYATTYADFCHNTWDMYASSGAYDSDIEDTFSGEDPEDCLYPSDDYEDYYTISDWSWCGYSSMIKPTGRDRIASTNPGGPAVIDNDLEQGLREIKNIRRLLMEDAKATGNMNPKLYEAEFNLALEKLNNFIQHNPADRQILLAMKMFEFSCYDLEQPERFLDLLNTINKKSAYNSYKPQLLNLFVSYNSHQNAPAAALNYSDRILTEFPDADIVVEVLYTKGDIYRFDLQDPAKAAAAYKEVIDRFPEHPTAESARAALASLGENIELAKNAVTAIPEFTISNFPNPFNPATSIKFTLPENGHVTLKIYDIQGREVITLIDAERQAGAHNIIWNSRDKFGMQAASGMYFYRIQYKGQVLTGKMILMR